MLVWGFLAANREHIIDLFMPPTQFIERQYLS